MWDPTGGAGRRPALLVVFRGNRHPRWKSPPLCGSGVYLGDFRTPRQKKTYLDDTAFFPYGPDRVDPGSFPPLEPHDVLAIEVAHALLQVRSDRFIRRLLRQGWSVATCRPETGRQFLDAVFHSLLVPDADAMNLFDAF